MMEPRRLRLRLSGCSRFYTALFQRYVPADRFAELFGKKNEEFLEAKMERPYVVCHMLASVDGKIDGDHMSA